MNVTGINHVNIRTSDLGKSVEFYVDIFGFEYFTRPAAGGGSDGFLQGEDDNWLYDGSGSPIIHLRVKEPDGTLQGPLDHIALTCRNKAEIIERLEARDIHFVRNDALSAEGVTQVYVRDPHGVALELNFSGE